MGTRSFSLQRYAGISSRHTCPACGGKRCFTLYVDESGEPLSEIVGRCDHESSCGYHYKPKDYFRDHPEAGGEVGGRFFRNCAGIWRSGWFAASLCA